MNTEGRYSEFTPMQALGESIAAHGGNGPARRSRWLSAIVGLVALGAVAVSPAGAAIADAVDGLIGGPPTTESIFLGDFPGDHQPDPQWQRYFDQQRATHSVLDDGATPLGTPFELILDPGVEGLSAGGPIASCVYLGFADAETGSRTTETCIGPTVSEGFEHAGTPIYPTIYRGPAEEGDIPTPIVIGVAPPEVVRVEVTYIDGSGDRIVAPSSSAAATKEMLSGPVENSGPRQPPRYAANPYLAFAAFLPPELDAAGPQARQPDVELEQIEITAFDGAGTEIKSMHMDGRFSGDPGISSVG